MHRSSTEVKYWQHWKGKFVEMTGKLRAERQRAVERATRMIRVHC